MKIAKKAQLSWFVVLGLVFLIILALLSWLAYSKDLFKKPQEILSSEEELKNIQSYITSCEKELAENALIMIGNQGGKTEPKNYFEIDSNKIEITLPSLEEITKDLESYIDSTIVRQCKPSTATKKEVKPAIPKTKVTFNDKASIIETDWPVTLVIGDDTQYVLEKISLQLPIRTKLIHETITKDLETYGINLNLVESLDSMDVKKVSYDGNILGIIIDHKSEAKDQPYKFFYTENI